MFIISNNCCGSMMYRLNKVEFNNPFVWAIVSYRDINYIMNNFYDIQWENFSVEKSGMAENTYLVNVDNSFQIHYIHYKYNSKAKKPRKIIFSNVIDDDWNGNVIYNKIWKYVADKYIERVKRMKLLNEPPVFLIHEENLGNYETDITLRDLVENNSIFRRYVITTDTTLCRNDNICCTSIVKKRLIPIPQITAEYDKICSFLSSNGG